MTNTVDNKSQKKEPGEGTKRIANYAMAVNAKRTQGSFSSFAKMFMFASIGKSDEFVNGASNTLTPTEYLTERKILVLHPDPIG